jgi:ArsR family metal-binding transcriptional regulator
MKLVPREGYEKTFDWIKGKKIVATITLYDEGLIEFSDKVGNREVAIESLGTKNTTVIVQKRTMESWEMKVDRETLEIE